MKSKKVIYKITDKSSLIQEEVGLNIYSTEEKKPPVVIKPKRAKTSLFNDIDINRWREYSDIITDSLWLIGSRDRSGVHTGELHGNFIPQIPHQAMLRYTKQGDWVLDTFLGSGTTLIECRRLGRNGIGIELLPNLVKRSQELVSSEKNPYNTVTEIIQGNSCLPETAQKVKDILNKNNRNTVQLIIMHPPYYDIIKFSNHPEDLCNAPTLQDFLDRFSLVVKNTYGLLDKNRYLVLVIGDKYNHGEWIPLSFYTMQRIIENGYKLKSIAIKNIVGERAKRNLEHLWRRRALLGGFYIFKHEYIMFFQKKG